MWKTKEKKSAKSADGLVSHAKQNFHIAAKDLKEGLAAMGIEKHHSV